MDHAVFAGPGRFIGIDTRNVGVATAGTLAEAQRLLGESVDVVTLAGPLGERVAAADVDPVDTGAEPEAGDAASEELIAWCEGHGAPWLLRGSGRSGGRHVLAVMPPALTGPWRQLCRRVARHHGVGITPRRTLRLLSAPHRHGLPAPVMAGTLTPADVPDTPASTSNGHGQRAQAQTGRPRRRQRSARRSGVDRSAAEYGDACARVRAGWSAAQAWAAANIVGSKASEQGELSWRRWVWSRAVTVVAAEQGLSEDQAWHRFRQASPARARQLERDGWRTQYWVPALEEAEQTRPRRMQTDRVARPPRPSEEQAAEQAEIDMVRTALRAAAERQLVLTAKRPQFGRSVAAALDALADALVQRDGSISERAWSEAACLARSTVRAVAEWACERGILYRARAYAGGTEDSAAWQPGPTAQSEIDRARKTQTTRWDTTPPARMRGQADQTRLIRRHRREQQEWRLRCELSVSTEKTGQTYAQSQHPAAKALRSLWHQRRWWQSLTPEQQEERRQARRGLLGRLHRTERSAWLTWLDRRAILQTAAKQIDAGNAGSVDHQLLANAPRTLHLGMRDPLWRTGGTPLRLGSSEPSASELMLQAA